MGRSGCCAVQKRRSGDKRVLPRTLIRKSQANGTQSVLAAWLEGTGIKGWRDGINVSVFSGKIWALCTNAGQERPARCKTCGRRALMQWNFVLDTMHLDTRPPGKWSSEHFKFPTVKTGLPAQPVPRLVIKDDKPRAFVITDKEGDHDRS